LFGDKQNPVTKEQIILFEQDGNWVTFKATDVAESSLDLLLIAGIPLGESFSRYGQFVINAEEEIREAISDYNCGRIGKIDL
jgi:redox-sensitive bicupin YhaK (pirin superfamily)